VTNSTFIPFALPDIGEEEIDSVVETLRSGWISTGPKTAQFERDFEAFLGGDVHAISVNSATAGLHLALEAIGIGYGDEVITCTNTFTSTAEVVRYLGAQVVFVDIDPITLCIDPEKIRTLISPRTKAIIPVHFAGMSCNMGAIIDIAKQYGLKVIEDAAHALPTTLDGRLVGTFDTDATVFSFYATKPLATGEGGMLVTRRQDIAKRARIMRLHGISRDAFDRYTSRKPSWRYDVVAPGFKYNLTDIASAIGIEQLKKTYGFQKRREEMAHRYDATLKHLPLILPPRPCNGDLHAWHLYVIQLDKSANIGRDEFIEKMSDLGVACSVHFIPLHLHPYWRATYNLKPQDFPNAMTLFERSVSLPLYTRLNEEQQTYIIDCIRNILSTSIDVRAEGASQ